MRGLLIAMTVLVPVLMSGALISGCEGGDIGEQLKDAAQGAAEEAKATAGAHVDQAVDAKSTELSATTAAKGEQLKETIVAKSGDLGGTVESLGSELGGTLESRGSEMGATLEAKGNELQPTLRAAATRADTNLRELREVADDLDGWGVGVATALGEIGQQAAELDADGALITDRGWRADTESAVGDLAELSRRASDVADELERDDAQSTVQSTLAELSTDLDELVEGVRAALEADDADAFMDQTRHLADLSATVDALTRLLEKLRPER